VLIELKEGAVAEETRIDDAEAGKWRGSEKEKAVGVL
jgi:hypothetical protein